MKKTVKAMKKICLLIILALASVNVAQADIWRSNSKKVIVVPEPPKPEKEKSNLMSPNWFIKAGGGLLYQSADEAQKANYNVEFGYQRPFTSSGVYWGAEVGSNIVHIYGKGVGGESDYTKPSLFIAPMIGIKKPLSSIVVFDGHLAAGYQQAFSNYGGSRPFWEGGIGVWLNSFLVEAQYQGNVFDGFFNHNILLNIGLKF